MKNRQRPANGASAHPVRSALAAGLVLVLAGGTVSAQTVGTTQARDATGSPEAAPPQLPSIPIFYGDSYEGRLSAANGYSELPVTQYHWGKLITRQVYAASFEMDLLEGDSVGYGLWTDSDDIVAVNLLVPDPENPSAWRRSGLLSSHVAKYRCVGGFRAPATGKHRIEVYKDGKEANYRLFILPRGPYEGCGRALPAEVQALFERPGAPASRQVAESWTGRTFRPRLRVPDVFGPPVSDEAIAYASAKPEPLRPFYQALYVDGEHNAVLNFGKLGLAAIQLGEYTEAEWAFDEALARIEAVYGRTSVAEAARSKWVAEGIKDFKGEPYERAMAYYYRGLLYLRAGDYENARAAFTAGEFQDTLSEAEQFQGDFALLNFLSGWSSHCIGDTAAADEAFAIAQRINPAIKRPSAGENTLVIADIGRGPVKMGRGQQKKLLAFVDPLDAGRDEQVIATSSDASSWMLQEYGNVHFQATTRGGRAFDAILDGKASLKSGLQTTASLASGLIQSGNLPLAAAGAVMMLVTGGVGAQVKPDADIRMWDTLPHRVSVGLGKASPTATYTFRFDGADTATSPVPVMRAHEGGCGIAWTRSRSAIDVPAGAPGNDADVVKARSKNREAVAKDVAFRAALRERVGTAPQ